VPSRIRKKVNGKPGKERRNEKGNRIGTSLCTESVGYQREKKMKLRKINSLDLEIKTHSESRKLKEMCTNNEEFKINTYNLRLI
jgi:hypothetical protein